MSWRERAALACALAAVALLIAVWVSLLHEAENPDVNLWKNAYWPFTVEASMRDR